MSKLRKWLIDQGYTIDPVSVKEKFGYFDALEYAKELRSDGYFARVQIKTNPFVKGLYVVWSKDKNE